MSTVQEKLAHGRSPGWALGLTAALAACAPDVQAEGVSLRIGHAHVTFDTASGTLTGPPGTTPDGVRAAVADVRTLGLTIDVPVQSTLGVQFQLGAPPVVRLLGDGAAAGLGPAAQARVWFPAVLGRWQWATAGPLAPYAGIGMHLTRFSETTVSDHFTRALGGTASSARLSRSHGPVLKIGLLWTGAGPWGLDLSYTRYRIRTQATLSTSTPGLGNVVRNLTLTTTPDVVALMVSHRF